MTAPAAPPAGGPGVPGGPGPSLHHGATRLAAGQGFQLAARLVTSFALARLLDPHEFGLIGLVTVVTLLLQRTLGNAGMINALVQRQEVSRALTSSVFWFNLLIGAITAGALIAGAPWISAGLGDPDATGVLRGLAVAFVIGGAVRVPTAMLRREMRYGQMATIGSANAAVNGIVAIGMAAAGFGVASMVVAQLAAMTAEVALAWHFSSWRPLATFQRAELRKVTTFARNLTLFNFVNYFGDAGDKFVVGRFVGTEALGHYSLSYRLLFAPVYAIAQVYRDLLFPAFSRNQDDHLAITSAYLRAVAAMSLVTFPLCAMTSALAGPLVDAALGPKWHDAGPILSVMALVALQQSVLVTGAIILTAKGRTDVLLRWGIASGLTLLACYAIGAIFGAIGVALGFLVGTTVLAYPAMAIPFRELSLPVRRLLAALRPAMAAAGAPAAAAVAARVATESAALPPTAVLAAGSIAGAAAYITVLVVLRPRALDDLFRMVKGGAAT